MKISTCCGAETNFTEIGICPECLEHCDFEIIEEDMKDKIVESVINKYNERSETGIVKYKTTLTDNVLTFDEWLTHLQEELMDATLYIEKIKKLGIGNAKLH